MCYVHVAALVAEYLKRKGEDSLGALWSLLACIITHFIYSDDTLSNYKIVVCTCLGSSKHTVFNFNTYKKNEA